jgi:hypothetical protein
MAEETALASASPETTTAPAAATAPADNAEKAAANPPAQAGADGDKGQTEAKPAEAGSDAAEAEKASEAAKALAARKQTAKERIDELTRARREADRRAERAEREAAELRAKLKEPDPAQFDDVSKLNAAQVTHTLDKREADRKAAEAKAASEEAETARIDAWRERLSVFKETATDWDAVALSAPINEAVAKDITSLEHGPAIAYYLGKHPAEARALNNLSERDRLLKLGEMTARLTETPARRTTQAPVPVDAVGGKGSQSSTPDPGKMTETEYRAWRQRQGYRG